ncbi:unnamed protein product [Rhizophagus irregularis]|nr:unnamed protein product [Rhizophagus irregularis]
MLITRRFLQFTTVITIIPSMMIRLLSIYTNTSGNVTNVFANLTPTTSSDPPHPLVPQYTQQQIQQVQQPICQQNGEIIIFKATIPQYYSAYYRRMYHISFKIILILHRSYFSINHSEILTFEIPGIKLSS